MATAHFYSLPYHGHINPSLAVLSELVARGERVICYSTEEFRKSLEATGAEFRLFPHEEKERGIAILYMANWQLGVAEQCLPDLIRDARDDGADYVLTDYACLWGRYLAQAMGLPLVSLYSTFPAAFADISPLGSLIDELRSRPSLWRTLLSYHWLERRLHRRYGIPRLGLPMNLVLRSCGDLRLVLTSRLLQEDNGDDWSQFYFIGPCVRPRGSSRGDRLPARDERPLIYISLGTIWNQQPEFYRTCIEAFREAPVQVIISVGAGGKVAALGPTPENIHILGHVDQIEVLRRAAVFVSHGGMNSVCEGLLAGVPLLLHPQANDQFPLTQRVVTLGAGLRLPANDVSPESLRGCVEKILGDPLMRARARRLAKELRASPGPGAAADLILAMSLRAPVAVSR
jgi:MGT family glycosyltransferase